MGLSRVEDILQAGLLLRCLRIAVFQQLMETRSLTE